MWGLGQSPIKTSEQEAPANGITKTRFMGRALQVFWLGWCRRMVGHEGPRVHATSGLVSPSQRSVRQGDSRDPARQAERVDPARQAERVRRLGEVRKGSWVRYLGRWGRWLGSVREGWERCFPTRQQGRGCGLCGVVPTKKPIDSDDRILFDRKTSITQAASRCATIGVRSQSPSHELSCRLL